MAWAGPTWEAHRSPITGMLSGEVLRPLHQEGIPRKPTEEGRRGKASLGTDPDACHCHLSLGVCSKSPRLSQK